MNRCHASFHSAGRRSLPASALVLAIAVLMLPLGVMLGQGGNSYVHDAAGNLTLVAIDGTSTLAIVSQPRAQIARTPGNASFSVVATGAGPITYQWQHNRSNLGGATSDTLLLTNVTTADMGGYRVLVTNPSGTLTSDEVFLDLDVDGDSLGDAWESRYFGSVAAQKTLQDFDNDGVSNRDEFREGTNPTNSASLFPRLQTAVVGSGTVGTDPSLPKYAFGQLVTLQAIPEPGQTFYEWGGDLTGTNNPATLVMNSSKNVIAYFLRPPNDSFENRILIDQPSANVAGVNLGATKQPGEPNHAGNAGGRSVWWSWIATGEGQLTIHTIGSAFDTLLAVYAGDSVSSLSEVASDDNSGFLGTSSVTFDTAPDTEYLIAVDGNGGASGTISLVLSWQPSGIPPFAFFFVDPVQGTTPLTVNFTDFSFGDITNRFWSFGDGKTTNTTATTFGHTYGPGSYRPMLVVTGPGGVSSYVLPDTIQVTPGTQNPFATWQLTYFGCTNCLPAQPGADPDGDGMSNTNEYLAGTNPILDGSVLRILSTVRQANNVSVTWKTAAGRTNAVQAATPWANGSINFVDITGPPHLIINGVGDVITNFLELGGATNGPARLYRIRLVP